jgi:hypothetical protein
MNTRDWWESRQPAFELYSGLGNRGLPLSELSNVTATASGSSATELVRPQKVGRNEFALAYRRAEQEKMLYILS